MPEDQLDYSLLPDELQQLAPLIQRYGESDDADREAMLEAAPTEELRALSEGPAAHWHTINSFLDEHVASDPGPYQDLALALDAFSQAAMEAQSELENRD